MALSRLLLLPRQSFHFHKTGPRRWCSSSASGGTQKSSAEAAERNGAVAEGSEPLLGFAPKYKEMASGVPPKETEVKKKVVKLWSTWKGMLTVIKEEVFGNHQSEKQITSETSDHTASNSTVVTQNISRNNEFGEPQSLHKSSEASVEPSRESISKNESKAAMDSLISEKNISLSVPSSILTDNSSDIVISHIPELAEEEKSGALINTDLMAKPDSRYSATHQLLAFDYKSLQKDDINDMTSAGNSDRKLGKKIATFDQETCADPGVDKKSASSRDVLAVKKVSDLFTGTVNNQAAREMASEKKAILTHSKFSENSNDKSKNLPISSDINGVLDWLNDKSKECSSVRSRHKVVPSATDHFRNVGLTQKIQLQSNIGKSDVNYGRDCLLKNEVGVKDKLNKRNGDQGTEVPLMMHTEESLSDDKSDQELNVAENECMKSKPSQQVHITTSKEDLFETVNPLTRNKVLVRFLFKTAKKSDILSAFECCGPIHKIQEIASTEKCKFKAAYIYFETREGLQNALKKQKVQVLDCGVLVEATSSEDMPNRISVPNLIGDPDVPVALVRNPTRTVVIKWSNHDISSYQLKEVLTFCGSSVSNIFWGSSSSVAYVEFEREDAKERAIAKHSINVSGKQLRIFRIDTPRTTVVRISNVHKDGATQLSSICKGYGKTEKIVQRSTGINDVYYALSEWPNMLHILNSLNGKEVNGCQWIAEAAPVFPPNVLQILWSRPDERRQVKAAMVRLLQKIEVPMPTSFSGLTDLKTRYCIEE